MIDACKALEGIPSISLAHYPTPVEELHGLRRELGVPQRLYVKRDDAISFAFGGNKVRKIEVVAAEARAAGADTFVTMGGVQSNHARVTAAAAARLGMKCVLIANGTPPARPTANALLDALVGAEVHYVASRDEREPAMQSVVARLQNQGRRPFAIPLGASTPRGASAFARAVGELTRQMPAPDLIVHATSSGGTQAGLVAGCAIFDLATRVLGISADDLTASVVDQVRSILSGLEELLVLSGGTLTRRPIAVDDTFVGDGYGRPTPESEAAMALLARTEALFLDPTYTAKAMAGLIAHLRSGRIPPEATVLFWHTGGQVALFA
ncbi:MAG: pyridoxal-phosphate dependent enzyme [Acidobacteria bacterium]|nr:pyridoxal-phosphate dependent enzyme [Acidobacteriota bacterium]